MMRLLTRESRASLVGALCAIVAFGCCAMRLPAQTPVVSIAGATTLQPLLERLAERLFAPAGLTVRVRGGGSNGGLAELAAGRADIAMVSRTLTDAERQRFGVITLAYDAVAVIVNAANPVVDMPMDQLRAVFNGRVTHWSTDLPGTEAIMVVSKYLGRGTLETFETGTGMVSARRNRPDVPAERTITGTAWDVGANIEVLLLVGGMPNAVGFVSLADVERYTAFGHPVRALAIDGIVPWSQSIRDGSYPLIRPLSLVYRPDAVDATLAAVLRLLDGAAVRAGVAEFGFVAVPSTAAPADGSASGGDSVPGTTGSTPLPTTTGSPP